MVCARERHRCKFNIVMAAVSTPSSPPVEVPPIQLVDCMEELLKFTLLSSLQGKLWTGLSNKYCATLLRDDPSNTLSTNISNTLLLLPQFLRFYALCAHLYSDTSQIFPYLFSQICPFSPRHFIFWCVKIFHFH